MHIFTYLTEINILQKSLLHAKDFFTLLNYFNCCFKMFHINMKKTLKSTKSSSMLSITHSNSVKECNIKPTET